MDAVRCQRTGDKPIKRTRCLVVEILLLNMIGPCFSVDIKLECISIMWSDIIALNIYIYIQCIYIYSNYKVRSCSRDNYFS